MQTDYTLKYLVRVENVPDDIRTPAKDDAADQIEELWGLSLSQIADRAGYSRQHIKNTLEGYFDLFDEPPENVPDEEIIEPEDRGTPETAKSFNLEIPNGVDPQQFVKGYSHADDVDDLESYLQGMMARYMQER